MNVVLIGFSGSGKSTVGRLLAQRLGWDFVDTDAEVERIAGKRIHQIFAEEGEAVFRRIERETVLEALGGSSRVVAVGGGAVVDPTSRTAAREGNLVVLLEAAVDTLHQRLAGATDEEPRPMLGMGGRARIVALKVARDPVYRETAHLVVSTEGIDVETVARQVAAAVLESLGDGEVKVAR